ncbi:acyl-CoA thioester hydrolase/BAAT C-terminal domain-containing protein [Anaerocolumna sp. AGMB13025]|uniref:acyl-CoA thioester hydrolase/BAAT C-terminal domain-containing protein n=1 Tax=Anaerocolumna sp. AGMB13025 TaxID=3039116 RepID=UPI00241F4A23|nr:acyl-CoA thioester hydrolase/BAAT C-terminal domain-containing protein [Anaerocolumna sp. AGMB13025]WFR57249.1 acyl-CoA thioester hydrolase/BAAT C-terminal domain-containing protein [Anaerocolumna sp. AGMB13025]
MKMLIPIITSVTNEGFDGIFYPTQQKENVIIFISGSEGGLGAGRRMGLYYQGLGYSTLALGLFHTRHTNKSLSKVPVEYMERAVDWLKKGGYSKIVVDGISKGSEYALYASAVISDITGVIARVPSYFISEGLAKKRPAGNSCWSYKGRELSFTPYKTRIISKLKMLLIEKQFSLMSINRDKNVTEESVIPVEQIHGSILLMSTQADTVWPCDIYAKKIKERLAVNHFSYEVQHISFNYMSHFLLPMTEKKSLKLLRILFRSERQHQEECMQERKEMERVTLEFLKKIFYKENNKIPEIKQ